MAFSSSGIDPTSNLSVKMTKAEAALIADGELQQRVAASLANPGPLHDRPHRDG